MAASHVSPPSASAIGFFDTDLAYSHFTGSSSEVASWLDTCLRAPDDNASQSSSTIGPICDDLTDPLAHADFVSDDRLWAELFDLNSFQPFPPSVPSTPPSSVGSPFSSASPPGFPAAALRDDSAIACCTCTCMCAHARKSEVKVKRASSSSKKQKNRAPHRAKGTDLGEKERKATASRPKDPAHIPRPPNAFIIFRSELCARLDKFEPEYRELSCVCGALWRSMTQEERRPYVERAVADAKTHMELYPDYVFSPKRGDDRKAEPYPRRNSAQYTQRTQELAQLLVDSIEAESKDVLDTTIASVVTRAGPTLAPPPPSPVPEKAHPPQPAPPKDDVMVDWPAFSSIAPTYTPLLPVFDTYGLHNGDALSALFGCSAAPVPAMTPEHSPPESYDSQCDLSWDLELLMPLSGSTVSQSQSAVDVDSVPAVSNGVELAMPSFGPFEPFDFRVDFEAGLSSDL